MTDNKSDSKDYYPDEQLLFTVRASAKKRMITSAIFALFILVTLAGILVVKNVFMSVIGAAALIMAFWPLADAYDAMEVTNMRIKRSEFSKKTSKVTDIQLDRLAACRETEDGSEIELLFFIDDSITWQSVRCLRLNKAGENVMLLTKLPCPMKEDLEHILAERHR
ncbi:MAG: hypothetical protein J5535_07130 [Firmicutes bacterium]|nr:hypothetical protein [Bacillota bacterium]